MTNIWEKLLKILPRGTTGRGGLTGLRAERNMEKTHSFMKNYNWHTRDSRGNENRDIKTKAQYRFNGSIGSMAVSVQWQYREYSQGDLEWF